MAKIPKQYLLSYEQYKNDPDPINVMNELARCRTLLDQFSDSLEANKEEQRDAYLKVAQENFESQLDNEGIDEDYKDTILKLAQESYCKVYDAVFQPLSRMTYREAEAMSKILKTTADIAEKYHSIQDGVTVKLEYNEKLTAAMMAFIVRVVMPNIPLQLRPQVAASARNFFPALSSADVIDAS